MKLKQVSLCGMSLDVAGGAVGNAGQARPLNLAVQGFLARAKRIQFGWVAVVFVGAILLPSYAVRAADPPADTQALLEQAREDVQAATRVVEATESDLRNQTGRVEVSSVILHEAAAALDDQVQALELERIATDARMNAISQAIRNQTAQADDAANKDAASVEMDKVAAAEQKNLDRYTEAAKNHQVADAEVTQAEKTLAEAKAQVAVQRAHAFDAAGGDIVIELKKELTDLQIAEQERDAKLNFVKDQSGRLRGALSSDVQLLEDEQGKLQAVRARADVLENQVLMGKEMGATTRP